MSSTRVFISYSHDSPAHRDTVLELANRLRQEGIEAILDRYVNGSPPEGWPRWMMNQLDSASHVVCICTETYYKRFRGLDAAGKGVNWEGAIMTQELYDKMGVNTKFIPVVFSPTSTSFVPEPLRSATYYRLPSDFVQLYDAILGQAGVEPPPVGTPKLKPKGGASASASTSTLPASPEVETNESPKKPTEEEIADIYRHTAETVESALQTTPALARFLGAAAPPTGRLIAQQSGQWQVLPVFRNGGADVCPVLQSASQRVQTFSAPRPEWDALEQIVGGILVLGINPLWIWEQRSNAGIGPVLFPKRAAVVDTESSGKAQFLPAIAAALASGCARLERVFGPMDSRRVPDIPSVMPGITADDRSAEIKRHFIRYVLGPSEEYSVEALSGEALDTLFNRVRQLLRLARSVDRDPYYAHGPNLSKLASEVKAHLELSDLYLFVPGASGDESLLMTDPVIALSLAQRLHKSIQTLRPNT